MTNFMLKEKMDELVNGIDFDCSVEIKNQKEIMYRFNDNKVFFSASLIKLAISEYALKYEKSHPNYINDELYINTDQIVHGAGIVRGLSQNNWRIRDLVYLMIAVSDNTATNVLIDYFSLKDLRDWSHNTFTNIYIGRHMMRQSKEENLLNAEEILSLWEQIFNSTTPLSKVILNALKHQQNKAKLEGRLSDISFKGNTFNKTGELSNEEHDIARFQLNNDWIDCVVLTHFESPKQRSSAISFIQDIGLIIGKQVNSF